MSGRPDRLAKEFVEAALEFHRRRVWSEVPGDAVFLVRVPTEELPLAATVMGQGGEEFGLMLVRGAGALHRLARLCQGGPAGQVAEGGSVLSVSFEAWGSLTAEFRRLVQAAGLQPRRERAVPVALAKHPRELTRPAGRAEVRTLLWALRAVLAAHESGELRATPVPPNRLPRHVQELEVAGTTKRPTVTATRVPWPADDRGFDPPPLVALPGKLRNLPRRGGRWLAAWIPMAAEVEGDERSVHGVFIVDERELILEHDLAMGDELAPVAEALARAFEGTGLGEGRGIPDEIVFNDPRLHHALAPALAGLEIRARLDEDDPAILELAADLGQAAGGMDLEGDLEGDLGGDLGGGGPRVKATGPLAEWKALDLGVGQSLLAQALEAPRPRAMERYFGDQEEAEEILDSLMQLSPFGGFVEWLAADYRATRRSKTLLEKRLAAKRLDPRERVLLKARRDAVLSVFRVDASDPGATMEVEDVLTGERHTIHDKRLSESDLEGILLPLRLLRVEEWVFPVLAGPPLALLEGEAALGFLEELGVDLSHAGLRRDAHLVGRLWSWFRARQEQRPVLQNTDGDPFERRTATFAVDDPARLGRDLMQRDDLEFDERESSWSWLKKGASSDPKGRTILGRLELLDDRLVLEVNSEARLERARAWLEAFPGVRFERSTPHDLDATDRPLDDLLPAPPGPPPTPELAATLERVVREQAHRWLDEPVPLLGDLTPRQACATEQGRRHVARLVRTMPPIGTPNGPIAVPRGELLRELGIAPGEGPAP